MSGGGSSIGMILRHYPMGRVGMTTAHSRDPGRTRRHLDLWSSLIASIASRVDERPVPGRGAPTIQRGVVDRRCRYGRSGERRRGCAVRRQETRVVRFSHSRQRSATSNRRRPQEENVGENTTPGRDRSAWPGRRVPPRTTGRLKPAPTGMHVAIADGLGPLDGVGSAISGPCSVTSGEESS